MLQWASGRGARGEAPHTGEGHGGWVWCPRRGAPTLEKAWWAGALPAASGPSAIEGGRRAVGVVESAMAVGRHGTKVDNAAMG